MQPHWSVTLITTLLTVAASIMALVKVRREAEKVRREAEKVQREADAVIAEAAKTSVTTMSSVIAELHAELDDRTKELNRLKARVRALERQQETD